MEAFTTPINQHQQTAADRKEETTMRVLVET
jgi:hypothetical protein